MSLGTSNRDGGRTSESGHLRAIYKALFGEVLSGLKVSQRGAGANMSVDVAIGDAVIPRSDATYGHPSFNDAIYNQAIAAADVSNPRRDIIVMYIDYGVTPSTGVSNNTNGVVAIKSVAGTPAGSPADPSDVAIQASVGSGNPWIKLARVAVAAGATSITDSVITDLRTMASGLQQAGGPLIKQASETIFDHVVSNTGVWSGDAYGSTRNASMTAAVVYIGGVRHTVAAVSARNFTASRDTYIDALSNGDGTATLVYTETTNNVGTGSPALAANSVRIGIIVTAAGSIASVASVNQGEENKVVPIVSSIPYAVTDSLGNLICNRNPNQTLIGLRQIITTFSTASSTVVQVTGLSVPIIVPTGRKVKISFICRALTVTGAADSPVLSFWDGTVGSGTMLMEATNNNASIGDFAIGAMYVRRTLSAGLHTINLGLKRSATGTVSVQAISADTPIQVAVELI